MEHVIWKEEMKTFEEWLSSKNEGLSDFFGFGNKANPDQYSTDMDSGNAPPDPRRHPGKRAMDKFTKDTFFIDRIDGDWAFGVDENGKPVKHPLKRLEFQK